MELRYRADIDGLRAVAVSVVVLYHAGFSGFPGGFVGVDVFFVISGFLITSLLVFQIDSGKFSLQDFWTRRARRIIPALVTVMLFSFAVGWFVLSPNDFRNFGRSLVAQSVFSSNILFWQESGYFAAPSESKPLLHTWSLAIEEQFYLLFPTLLWLASKAGDVFRRAAFIVTGLLSFLLCVYLTDSSPEAAFYLIPTRAWELLLGATIALIQIRPSRVVAEMQSLAGLAMIGFAVFWFSSTTPFPGWAAAAPTIGTALLIYSNSQSVTGVGWILSRPFIVYLGLISYSLYLWHWPILVFTKYHLARSLSAPETVAALALSVFLAALSYRYIETPLRRRTVLPDKARFAYSALGSVTVVMVLGIALIYGQGLPQRVTDLYARQFLEAENDWTARQNTCHNRRADYAGGLCVLGKQTQGDPVSFLAWGDSHMAALMPALDQGAAKWGVSGLHLSLDACPPFIGVHSRNNPGCRDANDLVLDLLARRNITTVILHAYWSRYSQGGTTIARQNPPYIWEDGPPSLSEDESSRAYEKLFRRTMAALGNLNVYVVRSVPEHEFSPPQMLALTARQHQDVHSIGTPLALHLARTSFVNSVFDKFTAKPVSFVSPETQLCQGGFCRTESGGFSLYRDSNHLSHRGAVFLEPLFDGLFRTLKGGN